MPDITPTCGKRVGHVEKTGTYGKRPGRSRIVLDVQETFKELRKHPGRSENVSETYKNV